MAAPDRIPIGSQEVEIEGRRLALSNLDKVLWPEVGFTKGQMIEYYVKVAPVLVPHIARRPLTLNRFPDGVEGLGWYQAQCRGHPPWMATRPIRSVLTAGKVMEYCVVNDLPSLVWVANLGTIELHPFLAVGERVEEPTVMVFDLDPGPPAGLVECCEVALWVRQVLDGVGLRSLPKTSGSKGLQVYVPLNSPHTYPETKGFARAVAAALAGGHPDRVVDVMTRSLRAGKVFVDWGQNDPTKSTVSAYSLRARARPTVSTPVGWDEVEDALEAADPRLLTFEAADVIARLERVGDLFAPVLEVAQTLPR